MAKAIAKGKKKQKERDAEEFEKLAKVNLERTPVRERSTSKNCDVPTGDLIQVVADTIEEFHEELAPGLNNKRLHAEETARMVAGSLIYGMHGCGAPVKVRETEVKAHYCKEHK